MLNLLIHGGDDSRLMPPVAEGEPSHVFRDGGTTGGFPKGGRGAKAISSAPTQSNFRLIESTPCDAATNMSVDEALLLSYQEGISAPALRLYGWRPHAFSVGYSQDLRKLLDLEACRKNNIDVVRRPTGGGILFHGEELTYSVVAAISDLGAISGVKASYYHISSFLIAALRSLGIEARFSSELATQAPSSSIADFCLERKEPYDILIYGKKFGGHAQKRRKNIILQHGTLPLITDKDKLSTALVQSFASLLGRTPKSDGLSTAEQRLAEDLKASKYTSDDWNLRRQEYLYEVTAQTQMA